MKRGVTMVETLIYVVIFVILVAALVQGVLTMSRSFADLRQSRAINYSAQTALERMTREVKSAGSIDDAGSIFGVHPGRLKLDTAEFYISEGKIVLREAGSSNEDPLTSDRVTVDNLVFRKIEGTPDGVKIELTISDREFYSTAVIRGAY